MSSKYFKRGQREYFQITKGVCIRIINKEHVSFITIAHANPEKVPFAEITKNFMEEDALEGTEITREEFAKEFEVASRLIVLEP
jgi:TRAP-type C4-dicarboxylate transport system substrate-binding protein